METPRMIVLTLLMMIVTVFPISASTYLDGYDAVEYFVEYLQYVWS
ncbi:MAG: hypothetical protein M3274_03450 [Actinomycetota bacterium]|jgi:hypothetical protein|nr:hypothetical protein [Actinomycetota bacterium]